ncbi:hypothetical protein PHET_03362 [Paragonimus heterotremus]|uniref:Uncharacterized protein n=1 Tax=Paragonimus heterotremus TaxID=100268 RepID=A0A8J4TC60_9TREM|nr:hypothetical protein PHET_03362 [Paragonimus heterotremus]
MRRCFFFSNTCPGLLAIWMALGVTYFRLVSTTEALIDREIDCNTGYSVQTPWWEPDFSLGSWQRVNTGVQSRNYFNQHRTNEPTRLSLYQQFKAQNKRRVKKPTDTDQNYIELGGMTVRGWRPLRYG